MDGKISVLVEFLVEERQENSCAHTLGGERAEWFKMSGGKPKRSQTMENVQKPRGIMVLLVRW